MSEQAGRDHDSWAVMLAMLDPSQYATHETRLEILIRTLITNNFRSEGKPLDHPPTTWEEVVHSFGAYMLLEIARTMQPHGEPVQDALNAWVSRPLFHLLSSPPLRIFGKHFVSYYIKFCELCPKVAREQPSEEFSRLMWQPTMLFRSLVSWKMRGRKLVSTTKKRLLGLASSSVEPGDQIWIFRGAKVPYVVRKMPDGMYEFMGEAYLYGLMNGEALFAEHEEETIVLQ